MEYRSTYLFWKQRLANTPYSDELAQYESDENAMQDAFYRYLEFGTAGMRGVIGLGTNRMNIFTVRRSTQGLANYIKQIGKQRDGVCIAYDSRIKSDIFAREAALVLCANGIHVYLYDRLTSVPQLSFSVLHLGCAAGIVITASHNPAKYNGYKVYGPDGGQLANENAQTVMDYINAIDDPFVIEPMQEQVALNAGLLEYVGEALYDIYFQKVESLCLNPDIVAEQAKTLHVVYTPLHGTGNLPVQRVLHDLGVMKLQVVPEQQQPDGRFPTISAPNPENPEAFTLAIALANQCGANMILATDPDCDRLGVAVRNHENEFDVLTGNEIGCLLMEYVLSQKKPWLNGKQFVVKSIVSTPMADQIAAAYGVEIRSVLTGFKYIAEQIQLSLVQKDKEFLFGYEESYGFLAGTFVRDKDACIASMLITDATCYYASKGMTLYDALQALYQKYGYYSEKVISITREGIEGIAKIKAAVQKLREESPKNIAGFDVLAVRDYLKQTRTVFATGEILPLTLPTSDVLFFELEQGNFMIRPSGTEPKLKAYLYMCGQTKEESDRLFQVLNEGVVSLLETLIG